MLGIGNSALLGMQIATRMSSGINNHTIAILIILMIPKIFRLRHSSFSVESARDRSPNSPNSRAILHNDAMKLAAQKNEYHWLPFSTFDATFWQSFGAAFTSAMVVSATVITAMLISKDTSLQSVSQLLLQPWNLKSAAVQDGRLCWVLAYTLSCKQDKNGSHMGLPKGY